MIDKGEIIWFVHFGYNPPLPLRFQRMDNFNAEVIGGKYGPRFTSHIETYWSVFSEIIKLGYIPVNVAINLGLLNNEWQPPSINILEHNIKKGIYKLIKEKIKGLGC